MRQGNAAAVEEINETEHKPVIMLPIEFYVRNSTTWLLWLFENCSHEVLVCLVGLGALGVVLGVGVLVFRLVNELIDLLIVISNFILRTVVRVLAPPRRTREARRLRPLPGNSLGSSVVPLGESRATRASSSEEGLSRPQSYTQHPPHWETDPNSGLPSSRLGPQALDAQALSSAPRVSRASLRRSRRTVRPRVTDSA